MRSSTCLDVHVNTIIFTSDDDDDDDDDDLYFALFTLNLHYICRSKL